MRYMHAGKRHDAGLGSLQHIGLAKARELAAAKVGALKGDKVDPLAERVEERAERRLASATFDVVTEAYLKARRASWRNAQHAKQWRATLTYASPVIGHKPVNAIDTAHVLEILEPLWKRAPPTASRLRGRIEAILDYAAAHGWRSGANPAVWRGNLKSLLPPVPKLAGENLSALPLDKMPTAFAALQRLDGIAARRGGPRGVARDRPRVGDMDDAAAQDQARANSSRRAQRAGHRAAAQHGTAAPRPSCVPDRRQARAIGRQAVAGVAQGGRRRGREPACFQSRRL